MLGLGNRSMTTICLCLFILLINQLLLVRSFRLSTSDIDLVKLGFLLILNSKFLFYRMNLKTYDVRFFNDWYLKTQVRTSIPAF